MITDEELVAEIEAMGMGAEYHWLKAKLAAMEDARTFWDFDVCPFLGCERIVGSDKNQRCVGRLTRANPDGMSVEKFAALTGKKPKNACVYFSKHLRSARARALFSHVRDHIAA